MTGIQIDKKSIRLPRGTKPLYLNLPQAFQLAEQLYEQGGGQASHSLVSQLTGNSPSSSSFWLKLAALKSYGLVTWDDKTVSLSDLGRSVVTPQTPEEGAEARKQALLQVELFEKIYGRYKGKLLPANEYLRNMLNRELAVPNEVVDAWVEAFKEAVGSAGLIHQRSDGKIQILDTPVNSAASAANTGDSPNPTQAPGTAAEGPVPQTILTTLSPIAASGHSSKFELSGGRVANFYIPDKITSRDAQKLKGALSGLIAMLDSMVAEDGPD